MPRRLAFVLIVAAFLTTQCTRYGLKMGSPSVSRLGWIAGTWEYDRGDGILIERWSWVEDRKLVGGGWKVTGTDTISTEALSIEKRGDDIYYIADVPENRDEVLFKLVHLTPSQAIFENLKHDFPQRFIYELKGDQSLYVRAEGVEDGRDKTIEFHFKPVN